LPLFFLEDGFAVNLVLMQSSLRSRQSRDFSKAVTR